jgi:predicted nuclease of predicted toxin-antitoxin system
VRLLIDANLSPKLAIALGKSGFEFVHIGDAGLLTAPDRTILGYYCPAIALPLSVMIA